MLRELSPDLWVTERPHRFYGIEVGGRMTVVRLPGGDLFVHSPVALDSPTRRDLDALGPVRSIVAPNRFHHLFVGQYLEAYPEAAAYAAPGLPEKRPDLAFRGVLGDEAPPAWAGEIDQVVFRAVPMFNEVVFFHRRSRTVMFTDLVLNIREAHSLAARLLFRLSGAYGRFGPDRLVKLLVRDRRAARATADRILGWDIDRVVVTHGEVLETGGREALRASFAWLAAAR